MAYFRKHIFFCCNQKADGRQCCERSGGSEMQAYCKSQLKKRGADVGPGGVRVNKAGCLGRCSEGPCLVIYPEGVWYTYRGPEDIDSIISEHLLGGGEVPNLKLPELIE